MSARNDGGPAFPGLGQVRGMSLRDYFMAHAPVEPQRWFEPVMPPRPSVLPYVSEDGKRFYTDLHAAERAEGDNFTSVNHDAITKWDAEKNKQRYVQWPYAWADEMLAIRESRP